MQAHSDVPLADTELAITPILDTPAFSVGSAYDDSHKPSFCNSIGRLHRAVMAGRDRA